MVDVTADIVDKMVFESNFGTRELYFVLLTLSLSPGTPDYIGTAALTQ